MSLRDPRHAPALTLALGGWEKEVYGAEMPPVHYTIPGCPDSGFQNLAPEQGPVARIATQNVGVRHDLGTAITTCSWIFLWKTYPQSKHQGPSLDTGDKDESLYGD